MQGEAKNELLVYLKCAFYVICNALSVLVVLASIFYLNTFINDSFLPANWMTSYGEQIALRVMIAIVEAALLMCITYIGTRLITSVLFPSRKRIALWTTTVSFMIVLSVVAVS